jgi:hypothetical protein
MLIRLSITVALIVGLATGSAHAQVGNEYLDNPPLFSSGPTNLVGMHACDGPHLMSGVHIGNNQLLCLGVGSSAGGDVYRYIDNGTQMTINGLQMHTCRAGFAIKGIYAQGWDTLLCTAADLGDIHGDDNTQREFMHACPPGEVMVGIHVARNLLACARALD